MQNDLEDELDAETMNAIAMRVAERFRLRLTVMQDDVDRTHAEIREAKRQIEQVRAENTRLRRENAQLKAVPAEEVG